MLLQNLSNPEPVDILIIICHLIVIISTITAGVILMFKLRGKPKEIRNYLLGIALFFVLYGIAQAFMTYFEITFDPFVWRIDLKEFSIIFEKNPDLALRYDIIWRIQQGLGSCGMVFLIYQLEKYILEKKTKYVFTVIKIVTATIAVIFGATEKDDLDLIRFISYVGSFTMLIIPLIYFYFGLKTTGVTRKRAFGADAGILVMFFGVAFNSGVGKTIFYNAMGVPGVFITYYCFAAFVLVGTIIYFKSIKV